ncbi:MAG TPA: hypothetical protein VN734_08715 [Acidobacteriaceae bacterium]|nr:hypothetical protein [Acidobacteriaceae bacterium]
MLNRKGYQHAVLVVSAQSASTILFLALSKLYVVVDAVFATGIKSGSPAVLNVRFV